MQVFIHHKSLIIYQIQDHTTQIKHAHTRKDFESMLGFIEVTIIHNVFFHKQNIQL